MRTQQFPVSLGVRLVGGTSEVRVRGSNVILDAVTSETFGKQLLALTDEPGVRRMVLDLGDVDYLSGRVLAQLLAVDKKLRAAGGNLAVRNVSPWIHEVFEVTRLTRVLDVCPREAKTGGPIPPARPVGVLVGDEDRAVRAVLGLLLSRHGFAVWRAATGTEAVALHTQNAEAIRLAVLDVHLPERDGPATLAALRRHDPDLPCCFLHGRLGPPRDETLLGMGATQVFHKPFVVAKLLRALRDLAWPGPERERRGDHYTITVPASP